MVEGGWSDKALNWTIGALFSLLSVIVSLVALLWSQNKERHDERKAELNLLAGRIGYLELNTVGRDTLTEIKEEWREDLKLLRSDIKDRDKENREDTKHNHRENQRMLEKIEQTVLDLHRRLDQQEKNADRSDGLVPTRG